jgi:hypothetical protein
MSISRKKVSKVEWYSLFEKSLHDNSKRSSEEVEAVAVATAASPQKKNKADGRSSPARVPAFSPSFTNVTWSTQNAEQQEMANPLFNLAIAAENVSAQMAAEQAAAKAAKDASYAALVAERDRLKAECQAEMREALSKLSFKKTLRRIETMPNFECRLIKDGISLTNSSSTGIFKARASTPLQIAAFDGDLQRVQQLVTCSITHPVNDCGSSGLSPLWLAVYGNHFEVVKELLKHGANYNMVCERAKNDIKTPYELATKHAKSCTKNAVAILDLFNAYDRELFSSFDSF